MARVLRAAFVSLSLCLLSTAGFAAGRPIVLDFDPGIDDAIAILLALRSPELDVRAITVLFGNVEVDLGVANALKMVELAGRSDVPVARGAERPLVAEGEPPVCAGGEEGDTLAAR